jgi:hypothetical protein
MFGIEAVDHVGSSWVRIAIMRSPGIAIPSKTVRRRAKQPGFRAQRSKRVNFALKPSSAGAAGRLSGHIGGRSSGPGGPQVKAR